MPLLLVYGSLKRGFSNHHFLEGQRFLAEAETLPRFRIYDDRGFPAAVAVGENPPDESTGGYSIRGELWEVDDAGLTLIDWLEDLDQGLYERSRTRLLPPQDHHGDVLIYLYLRDTSGFRETGPEWTPDLDRGGASEIPPRP